MHQAGRVEEAEAAYRSVLGVRKDHPGALHFLGLLLHQTGRGKEGLPLVEQSVRIDRANADFHNNLGTVLRDLGGLEQAAAAYRKAVALSPGHIAARDNLGLILKELGEFEAAAATFRETVAAKPFHMPARMGLAGVLQEAGRLDEALDVWREALAIRPRDAGLLHGLAIALMEKGRIAEAVETFAKVLTLVPDHPEAALMLSTLTRHKAGDAGIAALEAAHSRAKPGSRDRMLLSFGLGKASEDVGDYGRAFDYFLEGNAARRRSFAYDTGTARRQFEDTKAAFDRAFFARNAGSGIADDTPVFVVGMPRSGTTLIEQIIASHPAVHGAGELNLLREAIGKTFLAGEAYLEAVRDAPLSAFAATGKAYVERLHARYPGHRHVTDKMPGNFMFVGMIKAILPNAKIVHCRRDARATCLSIFKTSFRGEGHRYAYDLAELADFHNLYLDIMDHWHEVLPGAVHDVRYEDFVADQEGQSRALIARLGLEWNDTVLAFHETDRPVRTASAGQVRQPMYKGSVELWKRYGDRLTPLLERLEARTEG